MTKQELIEQLLQLQELGDEEAAHALADDLLLDYIDDNEISKAFEDIDKWYA